MDAKATQYVWYDPADPAFSYEGRIDFDNPKAPVFVYPCSYLRFHIGAKRATLAVGNRHSYFENSLGVLVDGEYRGKILLHDGTNAQGEALEWFLMRLQADDPVKNELEECLGSWAENRTQVRFYDLSPYLDGGEHEITIFKRMDACHYFTFLGLLTEKGKLLQKKVTRPDRRIEVYGDSISCGEVSEAIGRCGDPDPDGHNGIYSNSFYSYPWILARRLGARLHDVSQGGIALQDGKGYFDMPNTVGMLSCYDKIENNPSLGERKPWDFQNYVPHVVIVAVGQNCAHPVNYMAEDYDGDEAKLWRAEYAGFIKALRGKYPNALIVLTTTILGHDPAWDRAIDQACRELADPKVTHFTYEQNGCGTCGHVRWPEAEKMASELQDYLEGFGDSIWEE